MSSAYEGRDPLDIAREAERDLASRENNPSGRDQISIDPSQESGINDPDTSKFPGATAVSGSAASGTGNNREIPPEEGGDFDAKGRPTKARDFEGEGGPEDKAAIYAEENPGADDVRENVR